MGNFRRLSTTFLKYNLIIIQCSLKKLHRGKHLCIGHLRELKISNAYEMSLIFVNRGSTSL